MGALNNLLGSLTTAGVSQNLIPGLVSNLLGSSATKISQGCQVILQNSNNPAVIKDEATKMAEIPNLPAAVAALLPELSAAQTPFQVVQVVSEIETVVHSSGLGGLGLPGLSL